MNLLNNLLIYMHTRKGKLDDELDSRCDYLVKLIPLIAIQEEKMVDARGELLNKDYIAPFAGVYSQKLFDILNDCRVVIGLERVETPSVFSRMTR
ncbi:MAG: hypothetical protein COB66_03460 [Coxiella sp. (in: Bacteria)]|nr:MAG: hypothetical protein COB66_03460 [Coxiella sp. (in: g-proteobacteria)]